MADSAIKAAGGADAPLHYKVPGAAVIRIKQVHVHYTDNSAGADWLPMVRIVSDSGHTMGQAADQAVKVTAGDDAAVTFHPGVKHAAAGTARTTPVAFVQYQNPAGLLPAGSTYLPIASITQTVAGVFTFGGAGPNPFLINRDGIYLFQLSCDVSNAHATDETIQLVFDVANAPNFLAASPIVLALTVPAAGSPQPAQPNGSLSGDVFGAFQNECDLGIVCSNTLSVSDVDLVVTQTSTGQI